MPGRAERAATREASRRGINGRRQGHRFAQSAQPAREIEILENRDVAIATEPFENVSPNENRLVAEMPAEKMITHRREPRGDGEDGGTRAIAPAESAANEIPPVDGVDDLSERAWRQERVSVQK